MEGLIERLEERIFFSCRVMEDFDVYLSLASSSCLVLAAAAVAVLLDWRSATH